MKIVGEYSDERYSGKNARLWYMNEATQESWNSRTLDRNISTNIKCKEDRKEMGYHLFSAF